MTYYQHKFTLTSESKKETETDSAEQAGQSRQIRHRVIADMERRQMLAQEKARVVNRNMIALAKSLLSPLPELPPEPKRRRKNK